MLVADRPGVRFEHPEIARIVARRPGEGERRGPVVAGKKAPDAVPVIFVFEICRADRAVPHRFEIGHGIAERRVPGARQNLRPRLRDAQIYRDVRGWDSASDHVPVSITLTD